MTPDTKITDQRSGLLHGFYHYISAHYTVADHCPFFIQILAKRLL